MADTVLNPIDQQLINVTRTCYSAYLQTCKYLGLTPYRVIQHTTLNEKFGIQADATPAGAEMPNVRYLVLGNMGHYTVKGPDNTDETTNYIHRANDASLYNTLALVMREVGNDIPADRRERYCLRSLENVNGKNYIVYRGLRFSVAGVVPQLLELEVINGVVTARPYVPSVDDLNPVPPTIPNSGTVIGSNKTVSASAIVKINLTAEEIRDITDAYRIRTGSTRAPTVSEMALCSGIDRQVTAAGANYQYREVIACQVNVFIATNHPIGYNSSGLDLTFDIGGVEPMLGTNAVNQATFR